jgi:hypothetical protein
MASEALAQQRTAATRRFLTLDNRYLPPLLITSILLGAHLSYGILEAWYTTALAIGTAIGAELMMGRITYGKMAAPSQRVHQRDQCRNSRALAAAVAILPGQPRLDHLEVRAARQGPSHLEPTNFGVSAAAFLAPATVTVLSIQWGNVLAPMIIIWVLGSVIVWRVGRAHISATYVASFLFFFVVTSLITGTPWSATVAPITGRCISCSSSSWSPTRRRPSAPIRAVRGRLPGGVRRDDPAVEPDPLRALLRAVHRRSDRDADRYLARVASAKG